MNQATPLRFVGTIDLSKVDKRELEAVIREVLQHEPPFAPSSVEVTDAVLAHLAGLAE
jgi:hypothetical protein